MMEFTVVKIWYHWRTSQRSWGSGKGRQEDGELFVTIWGGEEARRASIRLKWMRGYRQGLIGECTAGCHSQTWILSHVVPPRPCHPVPVTLSPSPCHPVVRPNHLQGSMKTWILRHVVEPLPNPNSPDSRTHQLAQCRWTELHNHQSPASFFTPSITSLFNPLHFWRARLMIFWCTKPLYNLQRGDKDLIWCRTAGALQT